MPAGKKGKFSPVALGDIAQLAAHILTGEGEHGLDDMHRGQLIIATGPAMMAGEELAEAASQALGKDMTYKSYLQSTHIEGLTKVRSAAKKILSSQSDLDESEQEYLLEYYSFVREGKTNYVSTLAFRQITGTNPQELTDFFKVYSTEFSPNKRYFAIVLSLISSQKTS